MDEIKKLEREIRERVSGYIIAALGLVAGLAWNDAIRALIGYLLPLDQSQLWGKFIYAIVITLLVVVLTSYIVGRLARQANSDRG